MVCLLSSSMLFSQSRSTDARVLVQQGVEARTAHRDREALELFQRAYELEAQPSTLAQRALAEQALGRWVDAEAHLTQALLRVDDPWIAAQRASLAEALRVVQEHLGTLVIDARPAGAQVFVDGENVGTVPLPAPLRLPEGTILLTVTLAGHATVERRVSLRAGRTSMETLELRPVLPPAPVAGVGGARASETAWVLRLPTSPSPVPWVLAGAGAAVFGTSVAFWVLRGEREAEVRFLCAQTDNRATPDMIECVSSPSVLRAYGSLESMNTGMNVVMGIGSVVTAAAVTWGVVDLVLRAKERRTTNAHVTLSASVDMLGAGFVIRGSF